MIWIDALYEKVRLEDRVVSMAIQIVKGINVCGTREILAIEPVYQESEQTYMELFRKLKERGLQEAWLVVSDAQHAGLQVAIRKSFLGASWQRCRVHFMRNILARVSQREKAMFAARLKQIWLQSDRASAMRLARLFIAEYRDRFPEAIETLRRGLEDILQFFAFRDFDAKKISSTNMRERMHNEIRRRSRVVGIFPNLESYASLAASYIIEYSEDWSTARSYIRAETIEQCRAKLKRVA